MRKTLLSALVASTLLVGGVANAALTFDLNGAAAGGVITATSLDWAPTSFLAKGGNQAITNFETGVGSTSFDVYTHAKLTGYSDAAGNAITSFPAGFTGEITLVAKFTETVSDITTKTSGVTADFTTTGAGWVEFYYSAAQDSTQVSGSGFNNGTLIGRIDGVNVNDGSFKVTLASGAPTVGALDQSANGNQYTGQSTVTGIGTQGAVVFGANSVDLDSSFFVTKISDFSILFNNISIALPYTSVDPSDCFNTAQSVASVGATGLTGACAANHINGTLLANTGDNNVLTGAYVPVVGSINGLSTTTVFGGPDFLAQTDFNSSVTGTVPEPGALALVGLALGAMGFAARRRRV